MTEPDRPATGKRGYNRKVREVVKEVRFCNEDF